MRFNELSSSSKTNAMVHICDLIKPQKTKTRVFAVSDIHQFINQNNLEFNKNGTIKHNKTKSNDIFDLIKSFERLNQENTEQ